MVPVVEEQMGLAEEEGGKLAPGQLVIMKVGTPDFLGLFMLILEAA